MRSIIGTIARTNSNYHADQSHPLYPEIHRCLKTSGLVDVLRNSLAHADIRAAFVFGSVARWEEAACTIGLDAFCLFLQINDPRKRDYYAEMCRVERWSTRTLEKKIHSMFSERTALSKKPAKLAGQELKFLGKEDIHHLSLASLLFHKLDARLGPLAAYWTYFSRPREAGTLTPR